MKFLFSFLFVAISYFNIQSQSTSCNDILGFWVWVNNKDKDSTFYDFNEDKQVVLFTSKGQDCTVKELGLYLKKGNKLYITSKDSTNQSIFKIKQLDCNNLKIVELIKDKEYGDIRIFLKDNGHRCDVNDSSEVGFPNIEFNSKATKYLSALIWFFLVYVLVAYFILIRYSLYLKFLIPFLIRWIVTVVLFSIILYSSAYGFFDGSEHNYFIKDGKLNYLFSILPYKISYGEGIIPKESLQFWITSFLQHSILMTIPLAVWHTWKKVIGKNTLLNRVIMLTNKAIIGIGIVGFATMIAISSAVSPDGPYHWILLLLSYTGLLYFLKKTFWGALLETLEGLNDFGK